MAELKYETGEKNVLYIHGFDDLISTEMCGHKIIHVHEIVYNNIVA